MPMDQSLNKDLHDAVAQDVIFPQIFEDDDEFKFRINTPNNRLNAYRIIWKHHPPCSWIIHDIDGTYGAMKAVVEAKAVLMSGIASCPGHRFHLKGGLLCR